MNREVNDIWNTIKVDVLKYLKDVDFVSLIAHGSCAEGTANKTSDFDLLVVCHEPVQERIDVVVFKEIEVDMNFFHEETLREQLNSLEELLIPGSIPPFACRLKDAIVLIDKENVGKTLIEMARQFRPSDGVIRRYSKAGFSYYYDAVGAMASGDYATSIHMARLGAMEILTGIMLKQRELGIRKKWLINLMDKKPAPKELFLRLMGLDTADKEQAQQCIRDLNKLISEFEYLKEQDI